MPGIPKPKVIRAASVLFVEGEDEVRFFGAFLRHLGLSDVEVILLGGKTRLRDKLPAALRTPGFQQARSYAIVRDADDSSSAAFQSVVGVLRDNRQPAPSAMNSFAIGPPKVGVYIVPGNIEQGMLEDLCMSTVTDHPVMPCVTTFMDSIKALVTFPPSPDPASPHVENYRHPNNPSKAKAKAFLAAQQHDLPSVGIAAEAKVWNFDHPCLAGLKAFLIQL